MGVVIIGMLISSEMVIRLPHSPFLPPMTAFMMAHAELLHITFWVVYCFVIYGWFVVLLLFIVLINDNWHSYLWAYSYQCNGGTK